MARNNVESSQKYISDVIDINDLDKHQFNLIASGCGTGKSFFITHFLPRRIPDTKPEEIIFVTSRSLTVDQQARYDGMEKFSLDDGNIINFWNNDDRVEESIAGSGMRIMTYDKIISILLNNNTIGKETLNAVKIVVFDECHALFSDTFIRGIEVLQVWIRDMIYKGDKFFIGMTATPGILKHNVVRWGVKIKQLNKDILMRYKANQMICTNFDTIPYLLATNRLEGKTLILCASVNDCFKLKEQIPNSAVLVSKNNKAFTKEMHTIRDYISQYEKLPDKYFVPSDDKTASKNDGVWYELKVLITTTTSREGYNLSADSGIKNIISCFGDDLHLTQICGRARYNLDNIVVAKTYIPYNNSKKDMYLTQQRKEFGDYMYNKKNTKWFSSVSHLVEHDVYKIKRFFLGTDEARFVSFINSNWLVPIKVTDEEMKKYRIWKQEDKDNLVKLCVDCKMLSCPDWDVTFGGVVQLLDSCLGYTVDTGRMRSDGRRLTYKIIVTYSEDDRRYEPVYPTEDDLGEN